MNSRHAWTWASLAMALLLMLLAYERFFERPPPPTPTLFAGLDPAAVRSVEIYPAAAPPIVASRANGTWRLDRPLSYPAQTNSIEALLELLADLESAARIPVVELQHRDEGKAAFGLEPPRSSVVLTVGEDQQQLLIGSLTAPGDQVFVQMAGSDHIAVVTADLLRLIPDSDHAWRNTLVLEPAFVDWDGMTITSGGQVVGLRMDPTNLTWRLVRPLNARADQTRLASLIQDLRDLQAREFLTDDPRADLEAMGLQPPHLEISFTLGTNVTRTLRFGRPVPADTNLLHAMGREPGTVIAVPAAPLAGWRSPPAEFRDRQLLRVPASLSSITVTNGEPFSLRPDPAGVWKVEPGGWTADLAWVGGFLTRLNNLRIVQFVKDVVAEPDLPAFGLGTPALRLVLNAESPTALQLDFSAPKDGLVNVRRGDENAVYALEAGAVAELSTRGGEFRERRVWRFDPEQVASVTVQSGGRSWQVLRKAANEWSLAPGSQGMINPFGIEEACHRLSQLDAVVWTRWDGNGLADHGLDDAARTLAVELKDGTRLAVKLGKAAPSTHVFASVPLDGAEWVFEFPLETFDAVRFALLTPSGLR